MTGDDAAKKQQGRLTVGRVDVPKGSHGRSRVIFLWQWPGCLRPSSQAASCPAPTDLFSADCVSPMATG